MEIYEIGGENYFFIKGKIYDGGFLEPDRRFADRAYAKQGGNTGEKTELSLVYQRLKRLTED